MKRSVAAKILDAHLTEHAGADGVGVRIDQTLAQDATGTMACLQFEALGVPRVRTELSVQYVDHNTLQCGFENADDHRYLQTVAARAGIVFSKAGNGICHQVHLERFGRPGTTLLGADSHTPMAGGLGQLGMGAGGLDVALAMAGEPFRMPRPRVCQIRLTGRLRAWCSAKDVALKILELFTTHGHVGWILEYAGPGVASLSVPERATIANMGAETGVTTSLFPSDEQTRRFLRAQGRESDWQRLQADPGAHYDRTLDLNLGTIVPMLAQPHSPGHVAPVRDRAGLPVDQVMIGSCTNASFRDLMRVAALLKGRTVHPRVSLGIAPGSRQTLMQLARSGAVEIFAAAGGRLLESACGFCIGNGQAPGSGAVSLRTSNRNFEGRSGTRDAQVFLVSPETAAASALAGAIIDPRDTKLATPRIRMPATFPQDDGMLVFPPANPDAAEPVFRGPNIGKPPVNEPWPDRLDGEVILKVGDRITTDHIMPAGPRLIYRSNINKYADYVFENVDPSFAERARANKRAGVHNVIVAGLSYGQGSSREHAALCPMTLGVKAVLARSFERIHTANLIHAGILPLVFADDADAEDIAQGDRIEIEHVHEQVKAGDTLRVRNRSRQRDYAMRLECPPARRAALLAGGTLAFMRREQRKPS